MQGDGQRPQWEHNFGEIAGVGLHRGVEWDYRQEGNGGQRKQEGFTSNIILPGLTFEYVFVLVCYCF